jgi:hypothetical protein
MKTAIKELIERIEKQMSAISDDPNLTERALYDSYFNCKNWAIELLVKEKEQISKAWDDGDYAYFYSKKTKRDFDNGEDYFKEKYQNK